MISAGPNEASRNWKISYCTFDANFVIGVIDSGVDGVELIGNTMKNCTATSAAVLTISAAKNVTFAYNQVSSNNRGITVNADVEILNINGNTFKDNGDHTLFIIAGISISITNNIFDRFAASGVRIGDDTTGFMPTDVKVSGNKFKGGYSLNGSSIASAIRVDKALFADIQNNTCRKDAADLCKYGINVRNTNSSNILVSNNDCYNGGATSGIANAGTATSFGAGNRNKDGSFSTTPN